MPEWIMAISAAVNVIVVVVLVRMTQRYAKETKNIASATREQADAGVKMAEEMRQQRMGLDRPNLLIRWEGAPPNLVYVPGRITDEELARFPSELSFIVYNDGPGPAKMLSAVCDDFRPDHLDYLLSKEPWTCTLGGRGLPSMVRAAVRVQNDDDLSMKSIVVSYRDLHDRRWETRLELSTMVDATGSPEEPDEMCTWVESGDQWTLGPFQPEASQ